MPTPSWAERLCAAALAACLIPPAAAGAGPRLATLTVEADGRTVSVAVPLDRTQVVARDHTVKLLGVRAGLALVLDSYASRPQSLSRCQAGHERWVRLIDLRAQKARWSQLAESCLKDVEPGDPVAAWDADGQGFTVNLLSQPSVHARVGPDGAVSETPRPPA